MTAVDDEQTLSACLEAGANRVIKKPVTAEVLTGVVKELLAVHQAATGMGNVVRRGARLKRAPAGRERSQSHGASFVTQDTDGNHR